LGKLIRAREEPPAPVEERSIEPGAPQVAMPRSPVRQPPNLLSQASPRPSDSPRVAPGPIPTVPLRTEASPSAVPAPLATPTLIADARAQVTGSPAPAPASPTTVESVASTPERSQEALATQARRMLVDVVPRVATQAQPNVARVLGLAAVANHWSQRQAVVDA